MLHRKCIGEMKSHVSNMKMNFVLRVFLILLAAVPRIQAQSDSTIVSGVIQDAQTGEPLPFANVLFTGTSIGSTTDVDGQFVLRAESLYDSITARYVGYDEVRLPIEAGRRQELRIELPSSSISLDGVEVVAKKGKYKKKGNPAVELIRNVIDRKAENRFGGQDYVEYDKYEKLQLDVTNLSEQFMERKILNAIDFVFEQVDTSEDGNTFLPFYLQETFSTIYYRDDPEAKKEYQHALKVTNIDDYTRGKSLTKFTGSLYQSYNVYDDQFLMLDQQFTSPTAGIAPSFYRFYIMDTVQRAGVDAVNLAFIPKNKYSLGFTGNLLISLDGSYRILYAELEILQRTNINFVKSLKLEQEYEQNAGKWVLARDYIAVDFELSERILGISGQKTTLYDNYTFNEPASPKIYGTPRQLIIAEDAEEKEDTYWEENRTVALSEQEADVYWMVDSLGRIPKVQRLINTVRAAASGYITRGPVDIGYLYNFISYNDAEGFRLRFGGKTNRQFSDNFQLQGYVAYGTADRLFKYSATTRFIFDKKFSNFPRHYLDFKYEQDNQLPGDFSEFANRDNVFFSFTQGASDKMLNNEQYRIDYFREFPNDLSYKLFFKRESLSPRGTLDFRFSEDGNGNSFIQEVTNTAVGISSTFKINITGRHFPVAIRYSIYR